MHSHLRHQSAFAPFSAHNTAASFPHSTSPPPEKKQKMSITQTYRLAHRARGKLSSEASRGDHDLRLLVGHANLLDSLMLDLQDAEREQEAWFDNSVAAAQEPKRVQWSDSLSEQHQLDVPDASDEEDSDEEIEEEEEQQLEIPAIPRRSRARSPPAHIHHIYEDEEDDDALESDDEFDNLELALVRTRSHSSSEPEMQVPDLVHDSDESDDESTPSSPEAEAQDLATQQVIVKDFAARKQQQQMRKEAAAELDSFFLPPAENHSPMVAAY